MSKSIKLYIFIFIASIIGSVWLVWNLYSDNRNSVEVEVCLFKKVTGVPCPSCGTTRSTMSVFNGNMVNALKYNPFGFIISGAIIICPIWIGFDVVSRKKSFYISYRKAEIFLQRKYIAIPLVALVALNWVWNVFKYYN